jgi:hypothetical protein
MRVEEDMVEGAHTVEEAEGDINNNNKEGTLIDHSIEGLLRKDVVNVKRSVRVLWVVRGLKGRKRKFTSSRKKGQKGMKKRKWTLWLL